MPELPELAEWWEKANAWATLVAVGVALFVAIAEGRRRRLEQADADAAQARMVIVQRKSLGVRIVNHSTVPLLDLQIVKIEVVEEGGRKLTPLVNNGAPLVYDVLTPNGGGKELTLSHYTPAGATAIDPKKQLLPTDRIHCTYRFMDAQGLRWERTDLQQPVRIIDPSPSRLGRLAFWR